MKFNRRQFMLTGLAAAVSAAPSTSLADNYHVPNGAIWFHFANLQHTGRMARMAARNMRLADIGDAYSARERDFPHHQGLVTSVVYAYNLRQVPSQIKAWHQPHGGELNPYTLPTQAPEAIRGDGGAPALAGGQRAEAAWVFQTAGEIATLELKVGDLIRNADVQQGTYLIVCRTAGPRLVYPESNYEAHITSSMMKWHLRSDAPRRVTVPRSFL